MAIRKLLKDNTAVLESTPTGLDDSFRIGRVTAVSYRLQTSATPFAVDGTWTSGSADTVSTTVQGTHHEGDEHVTVAASTTVVRGRYYQIDDGTVQPIFVQAAASVTGTQIPLMTPLERNVPTASSFRGITVTASLTTTDTSVVGPGQIHWKGTIGNTVVVWTDLFRVVRRMCAVPLTETELLQVFPAYDRYSPAGQSPSNLIEGAWNQIVLPRLAAKGIQEEDILDSAPLAPLLAQATMLLACRNREDIDQAFKEDLKSELDVLLLGATSRTDWIEQPQTAEPTAVHTAASERTGIRMSR